MAFVCFMEGPARGQREDQIEILVLGVGLSGVGQLGSGVGSGVTLSSDCVLRPRDSPSKLGWVQRLIELTTCPCPATSEKLKLVTIKFLFLVKGLVKRIFLGSTTVAQ